MFNVTLTYNHLGGYSFFWIQMWKKTGEIAAVADLGISDLYGGVTMLQALIKI